MTKTQSQKLKELPKLLKAIHERCLDCSAGSVYELKLCVCPDCPLFLWRTGELPIKTKLRADKQKIPYKKSPAVEKSSILQDTTPPKNKNKLFPRNLEINPEGKTSGCPVQKTFEVSK